MLFIMEWIAKLLYGEDAVEEQKKRPRRRRRK